ncbi:trypsin-like peptidase domain-containing protein [Candidatus Saccharibacteria bacterium]|nr:trypsin-like peptidase domain-containing protein [Candidatus Saccharibacteria bacterium]
MENEQKRTRKKFPWAVILAIIAVALSGTSLTLSLMDHFKTATPITFVGGGLDGNSANYVEGSIAEVANRVSSSVVSIVTSIRTRSFYGSYDSEAAGTGIIVSADGYILTNKHVIEGANKINVVLDDGTTYENVQLVATDPLNDVAFLKISGVFDLKPATLGDSKTISVGQQVIAIGNALGQYQNTVTSGIISGVGRSITASDSDGSNTESLEDMIQTDAAINPGNSGGPLVNAAGEVIGINTATGSSAENMGFAIPISSVKGMLNQLIEKGKASRAYLGVYTVSVTPEINKNYNVGSDFGAWLYNGEGSAVLSNSPAAKAGLKDNDVLLAINGVKIGLAGSLSNLIGEYKPGDTVQLTVMRDGSEIAINVTFGEYTK